jgi:hypothetical protein
MNNEHIKELYRKKKELEEHLKPYEFSSSVKDISKWDDLRKVKQEIQDYYHQGKKNVLMKAHKLCPACGQEKPLSAFAPDNKSYTGYSSKCRACSAKKK